MKDVRLHALDIEISVPDCIHYHDDGFVDSVQSYVNFLKWQSTGDPECLLEKDIDGANTMGGMLMGKNMDQRYFKICYQHTPNPREEIYIRGHEETHFIHAVKALDQLTYHMQTSVGIDINFPDVLARLKTKEERREVTAELGGFFSVHRRFGSTAARNCDIHNENMITAYPIYMEALGNL